MAENEFPAHIDRDGKAVEKPNPLAVAAENRRKQEKAQEYGMTATVSIKLEVRCRSTWAGSATGQEVMEIGGRETIAAINNALQVGGLDYTVIGTPDIGLITYHRAKK